MRVIEIRHLTKRFGPTAAVDDLSFSVDSGTVCGFLGPNGAGKTTTLRTLLGLLEPTAGDATINGHPYRELPHPLRTVGALLETSGFHPGRSGRNHLRYLTTVAGVSAHRADEVLELVGLQAVRNVRVGRYSQGMRQRLALAAALIGDPEVLLLDEPANGLDPEGMRWLRGFLRDQAAAGRTVVVSSHVLAEVAQTVDHVVIIRTGQLVLQASMSDLAARSDGHVRVRTKDPTQLSQLLQAQGFALRSDDDGVLVVQGATTDAVGSLAAAHGIIVLELAHDGGNLEDVFLSLVGGETRA